MHFYYNIDGYVKINLVQQNNWAPFITLEKLKVLLNLVYLFFINFSLRSLIYFLVSI